MKRKLASIIALFATGVLAANFTVQVLILNEVYVPDSQPGDTILPYSHPTVDFKSRNIATRTSDNLLAYSYQGTNSTQIMALVNTNRQIHTFTVPFAGSSLQSNEQVFQGNTLYYVFSYSDQITIYSFDISFAWPPVVTTNETQAWRTTANDFRWVGIEALENGGVVAACYSQHAGLWATVAYRTPAGSWSTNKVDLYGSQYSDQTAGMVRVAQHPENKLVYISGLKDATAEFVAAVMEADEDSLTLVTNFAIANSYPNNGNFSPHAFDSEYPQNFRFFREGSAIRVIGNSVNYKFVSTEDQDFLKVTTLIMYDIAGDNTKSTPYVSSNWTERYIPGYAYSQSNLYIVPISTNRARLDNMAYAQNLVADRGATFAKLGYWAQIGQGTNALAYIRRFPSSGHGYGVITRLP